MEQNNNDNNIKKKKIDLIEMWKDKRGRAKIKLALYLIFFLGVIIFVRVLNSMNSNNRNSVNTESQNFITSIKDNYEYDIQVNLNDNIYTYNGKVLGNNSIINMIANEKENKYYFMNNNYYLLDDNGNYILTTKDDLYPYFDYKYIDINFIKNIISLSIEKDNQYIIELNKLILNSTSEEYITMSIDDNNKNIIIDYTNLLKVSDNTIDKFIVDIKYSKVNEILSLE